MVPSYDTPRSASSALMYANDLLWITGACSVQETRGSPPVPPTVTSNYQTLHERGWFTVMNPDPGIVCLTRSPNLVTSDLSRAASLMLSNVPFLSLLHYGHSIPPLHLMI